MPARPRLRPNLASLPPNLPFLEALAAWWLAQAGPDPQSLADALFLVPTRRAARALSTAFLRQAGGRPLLLPRILPLGGLDEAPLTLAGALSLPQAVPPAWRLAVLTRFILAMGGAQGAPTQADGAWTLAGELANLLDEAARAEIDLATALPQAVSEDWAEHWQVTLKFLGIVTEAWPAWLAEENFVDIAARQIALLDAQAAAWAQAPPAYPVIAAGTNAAIPAVARLLRVVAHLPQGLVVLPGLDLALDEASWAALPPQHPQFCFATLLAGLNATRGDVQSWENFAATAPAARVDHWRMALLPADSLTAWQGADRAPPEGVTVLRAADQQEEAACIALALRDALATPGSTAALITPGRGLATRVSAELLRFDIIADDSAGEPLADTPPAVFLRLLATAVAENLRPVPLLALLKHPFGAAGRSPAIFRADARDLERRCLRGPAPPPDFSAWAAAGANGNFLTRLKACLDPLLGLAQGPAAPLETMLDALLTAAEALATTETVPGSETLWEGEEGAALATCLVELRAALAILPPQRFAILPEFLATALAGTAVRSRRALRGREGAEHPRLFIWGLLEARLQTADFVVLGGLVEGVWPPTTDPGPWMNRAMRARIGLPAPEEQIGLAAHDFVTASCAAPRLLLSAPLRRDGAPAVPSRWLVRLESMLGEPLPPHPALAWARALDRPDGPVTPVSPPAPNPPVASRPRQLSVTEIETWLRDPYAIYAKHILKIRKLKPLEESADAADFGSIVHKALQLFLDKFGTSFPPKADLDMLDAMAAALEAAPMRPALAAWWRPRLRRIADWVVATERERRSHGPLKMIAAERRGAWMFGAPAGPFTLTGQADRIERLFDGSIAILDYKTGAPPSQKSVSAGLSPQLPLEAAMVAEGGFGEDLVGRATELTYWHISGAYHPGTVKRLFAKASDDLDGEIAKARDSLKTLVARFDADDRPYLSQPHPGAAPRFSDYANLARVAEWESADDEGDLNGPAD